MREYITLECEQCKQRNYRTSLETKGGGKLSLKKYCKFCRVHTTHKSRRK